MDIDHFSARPERIQLFYIPVWKMGIFNFPT